MTQQSQQRIFDYDPPKLNMNRSLTLSIVMTDLCLNGNGDMAVIRAVLSYAAYVSTKHFTEVDSYLHFLAAEKAFQL